MNSEGLDALDKKILDVIKDNARLSYSDIGEQVGLSRVAVKNRMDVLEKNGVIRGYQTIINNKSVPTGVHFMLDVEATSERVARKRYNEVSTIRKGEYALLDLLK